MFAKFLSLALASLLISMVGSAPAVAQSRATGPPQADKVKAKITRVGTGKQARVEIKLKDNSKLKGYVGEIAQDHFTLIDLKQGTVTTITYEQVEKIKKTDQSWVTPLLLGAGTIGGVLILVVLSGRGG